MREENQRWTRPMPALDDGDARRRARASHDDERAVALADAVVDDHGEDQGVATTRTASMTTRTRNQEM